jgi:hypothetical protein
MLYSVEREGKRGIKARPGNKRYSIQELRKPTNILSQ